MSTFQNFRSAFHGFNREDVVHYMEYMNNKHASQVNQLKTDLQALQSELDAATAKNEADLAAKLEAAEAEIASLRAQLAAAPQVVTQPAPSGELEAYRRAERAERVAGERVSQMYQQANGALAEAATRADESAASITEIADRISGQIAELNTALFQSKNAMKSASAALYAITPLSNEE